MLHVLHRLRSLETNLPSGNSSTKTVRSRKVWHSHQCSRAGLGDLVFLLAVLARKDSGLCEYFQLELCDFRGRPCHCRSMVRLPSPARVRGACRNRSRTASAR